VFVIEYKTSFDEDEPDANRKTAQAVVESYVDDGAPLEVCTFILVLLETIHMASYR